VKRGEKRHPGWGKKRPGGGGSPPGDKAPSGETLPRFPQASTAQTKKTTKKITAQKFGGKKPQNPFNFFGPRKNVFFNGGEGPKKKKLKKKVWGPPPFFYPLGGPPPPRGVPFFFTRGGPKKPTNCPEKKKKKFLGGSKLKNPAFFFKKTGNPFFGALPKKSGTRAPLNFLPPLSYSPRGIFEINQLFPIKPPRAPPQKPPKNFTQWGAGGAPQMVWGPPGGPKKPQKTSFSPFPFLKKKKSQKKLGFFLHFLMPPPLKGIPQIRGPPWG